MPHPHQLSRRGALGAAAALGATLGGAAVVGTSASAAAARRTSEQPLIGRARGADLHVMSFNIRYDREGVTQPGEADHWPDRAPLVTAFLELEKPTLVGLQEAEFNQLPAVEAGLGKRYRMVGFGRDGGAAGEYSSILYDTERLTLEWWDQYWLSDTPDVISSRTWGNTVTRIVTWARFTDHETGRRFVHVNSHFDHQSENARVRSAQTVLAQTRGHQAEGLPVLFTADANAAAQQSAPYDVMVTEGGMLDTWLVAPERLTPAWGTFPNYQPPVEGGTRIDWVLTTPDVQVLAAAINPWTLDGRYPSDHTPVQALVRL